jgi:hypothetical protein
VRRLQRERIFHQAGVASPTSSTETCTLTNYSAENCPANSSSCPACTDYVNQDTGQDIVQSLKLRIVPITATVRVLPLSKKHVQEALKLVVPPKALESNMKVFGVCT